MKTPLKTALLCLATLGLAASAQAGGWDRHERHGRGHAYGHGHACHACRPARCEVRPLRHGRVAVCAPAVVVAQPKVRVRVNPGVVIQVALGF